MRHRQLLHELAKVAAGLVLGDFISLWWLSAQGLLPVTFLGMTYTSDMVAPGLVFDAILFASLVHYAWNIGRSPAIKGRTYLLVAGILFLVVAALHFWRLLFGVDLMIAGWSVPLWLSWVGASVTAYLSYMSFHLFARAK